jgi:hypothetical protein
MNRKTAQIIILVLLIVIAFSMLKFLINNLFLLFVIIGIVGVIFRYDKAEALIKETKLKYEQNPASGIAYGLFAIVSLPVQTVLWLIASFKDK